MGISNGRDSLQRVAFELSDGTFFKFAINPQEMTESHAARNSFTNTERNIFMQGYGAGLHTIQISGVTGVNKGAGFDKLRQLETLLLTHLQTGHDDTVGAGTTLKFHDFTNGRSWLVEFNQEGFQINQSVNNPLSYTYTINMVVVGTADTPATDEISWVVLGNINPSVSPKQVDTNYNYKYGKTQVSGEFNSSNYNALVERMQDNYRTEYLSYDSFFKKNQQTNGAYKYRRTLTPTQIISLYKLVYPDIAKGFNWREYLTANRVMINNTKGSILDYNQEGIADTGSVVKVMSADEIYKTLYGQQVNGITVNSYDDAKKIHDMLYASALNPTSRNEYMNYVMTTFKSVTGADLDVMPPREVERLYQTIYGNSEPSFTQEGMADLSNFFGAMRVGSLDTFVKQLNNDELSISGATLGEIKGIYSSLTGRTASVSDLENSTNVLESINRDYTDSLHPYNTRGQISIDTISKQYQSSVDEGFDNEWNHITDSEDKNRYDKNRTNNYLNPIVSNSAPVYAYYETKNILKV